jgi:hypothetical protein
VGAFQRIFGATIFSGTDNELGRAAVTQHARFNFMTEAIPRPGSGQGAFILPGSTGTVYVAFVLLLHRSR